MAHGDQQEMRVSTQVWHYRLLKWTYKSVPNTLCPYVDQLALAVLIAPFTALWKILTEFGQIIMVIEGLAVVFSILNYLGILNYLIMSWSGVLVAHIIVWGAFGVMSTVLWLDEYCSAHPWHLPTLRWKWPHWHLPKLWRRVKKEKPPKPVKMKKPKQPSILAEWLKAKHRRICPFLEFGE